MYNTQLMKAANTRSRNSTLPAARGCSPQSRYCTRAQNTKPMHHHLMKSSTRGGRGEESCTILTVFVKTC